MGQLNQFGNTVEPNHCDCGALNFMLLQLTGSQFPRIHSQQFHIKSQTKDVVKRLQTQTVILPYFAVASASTTLLANMIDCSSDDTMRCHAIQYEYALINGTAMRCAQTMQRKSTFLSWQCSFGGRHKRRSMSISSWQSLPAPKRWQQNMLDNVDSHESSTAGPQTEAVVQVNDSK